MLVCLTGQEGWLQTGMNTADAEGAEGKVQLIQYAIGFIYSWLMLARSYGCKLPNILVFLMSTNLKIIFNLNKYFNRKNL